MKIIEKVWEWLIWSSTNPDQMSSSLKGFLTGATTLAVWGAGVSHVQLPSELLTQLVDGIVSFVLAITGVVSAGMFLGGLVRKIVLTITGKNAIVSGQ